MGANVSKASSVIDSVTDIISESILEDISKCNATAIINQGVNVGQVDGNVEIRNLNLSSRQNLSLKCLQESTTNSDVQNKIDEKLKQFTDSKLSGLNFGLGMSTADSLTKSITQVSTTVDISVIKECVYTAITNQTINFGTIKGDFLMEDVNMEAVQNTVGDCIQKSETASKSITDFSKELDQTTSSSVEGILAGPMGSIIIGLIAIVALIIAYYYFFGGKKAAMEQYYPQ